jgi:hypothetical protein
MVGDRNQQGKRMWPSLHTAEWLFSASNVALIIGLVLTAVATVAAVWMANVRDKYLRAELSEAQQRIAEADAAGEAAKAAAAEANARAAEAALALERFKEPRILTPSQEEYLISRIQPFAGQRYNASLSSAAFDARLLYEVLHRALTAAGWVWFDPVGLVIGNPPAAVMAGQLPGVNIVVMPGPRASDFAPAARALAAALNTTGIAAEARVSDRPIDKPDVIRIAIGLKPQ